MYRFTTLGPGRGLFRASTRLLANKAESAAKAPKMGSRLPHGPEFTHFLSLEDKPKKRRDLLKSEPHPYVDKETLSGDGRKVFFEVRGCQMNSNDAEVAWSVLHQHGYKRTHERSYADVWIVVTCSIREGAEEKVWKKLRQIQRFKRKGVYSASLKVCVLGCMAERLRQELFRQGVADVVAGPDAYRDLPRLLAITSTTSESAINVLLSVDETYADITPKRLNENAVTGFVSIQRGCDNMCSYCIVPFTRGRERSRPVGSILDEVRQLRDQGVKEVTLLGQNVNSYRDIAEESQMYGGLGAGEPTRTAPGFSSIYRAKTGGVRFADLLRHVSEVDPEIRVRFTSPHPKDFPQEVLHLIAERPNICSHLHLPAQCGSSKVLADMRRGYTREAYLDLVADVRRIIPDVTLSSDFIAGFCGETDEEFEETLSLIKEVQYHRLYVYPYSMREKTHAHRNLKDDVPEEVKKARFQVLYDFVRCEMERLHKGYLGTQQLVLIEGDSKRSSEDFMGRNDDNVKVIFPKMTSDMSGPLSPGDYCRVMITASNSECLKGHPVAVSSISQGVQVEV